MSKPVKIGSATEVLVDNVLRSVLTAQNVLEHLENSLERGGFKDGAPQYQKMCDTLVGQRLWSTPHGNEKLEDEFHKLSLRASRIFETLSPYTEAMKKLAAVSSLKKPPVSHDGPDEIIFKLIRENRGPISFTALKTKAKLGKKELEERLDNLEKHGLVASKISSGRKIYFESRSAGR